MWLGWNYLWDRRQYTAGGFGKQGAVCADFVQYYDEVISKSNGAMMGM